MHELLSYRDYMSGEPLSYWRTTSGFEVDFILGDHTAIEVKAKKSVSPHDLKSLRVLAEEKQFKRYLCVCLEPRTRVVDGVTVLPYREFLDALWGGRYR
jgi:predicted AAA+ superfamily ATPase